MINIAEVDPSGIVLRVVAFDPLNTSNGFTVESYAYSINANMRYIRTYPDGSVHKNFAVIGYTYDATRDAFIPPKPFPSWILDETTCQWEAPVAMPVGVQMYRWDEGTLSWVV